MSSEPPPKRQTEPTLVIDRSLLPPIVQAVADAYPELPPDLIVTDPADQDAPPPTLVPCPTCQRCPDCDGSTVVTIERRSEILRKETGL